jgi:ABC-type molybdate transport system substrate-binding protein
LFLTLDESELNLIQSKRLIGKEKEVFDYILHYSKTELPPTEQLLKELSITDSHFYKIHSVLIRKCYEWLVPSQGLELLLYLKRKNLFNLLRHEILTQEKKLGNTATESFYLKCFHFFIDFPYKYYDKKLTDSFGEKYLKAKNNSDESDKLYVRFHKLFSDVNRNAARKNPLKALGLSISDLLKEENNIQNTQHHLAKYYLYRSICSYYTYYEKNNNKVIEYLEKAITLKKHIAYFFSIDIGQFLDLLYADALFTNNQVTEASAIYSKVFEKGISEDMYGYHFHYEQYCLILTTEKKYEQALHTLDRVFKSCIKNKLDIYATRGAMAYVKLYLSNMDLKKALHYLNIAKAINEKTFYLPFDIQLRVLENIYFFLKKDYEFALQLANRNIKFLKSQEQGKIFEDYLLFWKLLQTFINAIYRGAKLSTSCIKDYEYLNAQYINLYCNLITQVYTQTKVEIGGNTKPKP